MVNQETLTPTLLFNKNKVSNFILHRTKELVSRGTYQTSAIIYLLTIGCISHNLFDSAIPWRLWAFSLFMISSWNLTQLLSPRTKWYVPIFVLSGIGCLRYGQIGLLLFGLFTAVATLYSLFLVVVAVIRKPWFALDIFAAIAFAFIVFGNSISLYSAYVDPTALFNTTIMRGIISPDALMHLAIANSWLHQGIPSTALHGLPYMRYHHLGHLILATISACLDMRITDFYYFMSPYLYLPLMILLWEKFRSPKDNKPGYFTCLTLIVGGVSAVIPHPWMINFDPTYPCGLILAFLCLRLCMDGMKSSIIIPIIALSFFGKSSIGAVLTVGYALQIILRKQPIGQKIFVLAILGTVSLLSLWLTYSTNIQQGTPTWKWLAFYHRSPTSPFEFISTYFSNSFLLVILISLCLFSKGKNIIEDLKPSFPFLIASFLAGLVMINRVHDGGGQFYFLRATQWLTLPFIALLAVRIFHEKGGASRLVILLSLTFFLPMTARNVANYIQSYNTYNESHKEESSKLLKHYGDIKKISFDMEKRKLLFSPYVFALGELCEKNEFPNYVVEIPESEQDFWQYSIYPGSRYWMSFFIPILSCHPGWNGYNSSFMRDQPVAWYSPGYYGFGEYYARTVNDVCRDTNFRGIISLTKDHEGKVEITLKTCGDSSL